MEPTFVDQLAQSRYGPMVRCGVHDKSLQAKRMSIADAERFVEQVDRDINSQSGKLDAANVAGIVSWSAIIVTDIIRNVVKLTPAQRANIALRILDDVHGRVSKNKFDRTRYTKEIKHIHEVVKVLKTLLPGQSKELADLFGTVAEDSLGLAGFAQDGTDARASLDQSIRTSRANVRKMRELLKKIDAKIADDARSDDGGPAPVRSEALPPQGAVSLPGLR